MWVSKLVWGKGTVGGLRGGGGGKVGGVRGTVRDRKCTFDPFCDEGLHDVRGTAAAGERRLLQLTGGGKHLGRWGLLTLRAVADPRPALDNGWFLQVCTRTDMYRSARLKMQVCLFKNMVSNIILKTQVYILSLKILDTQEVMKRPRKYYHIN